MAADSIQDLIVGRVARRAWENELVTKYSKSYINKRVMWPSCHLTDLPREDRDDEAVVIRKGRDMTNYEAVSYFIN